MAAIYGHRAVSVLVGGQIHGSTDVIVLGAGVVGTRRFAAAKRGLSVEAGRSPRPGRVNLLRQCQGVTRATRSFRRFPTRLAAARPGPLKRATEANYHLAFLPKIAPWLLSFRAWSQPPSVWPRRRG